MVRQKLQSLPDLVSVEMSLVAVVGVLCGILLGRNLILLPTADLLVLPLLIFALLSFALHAFNAVFDRYLDLINKPHRPIPQEIYTPRDAFVISLIFYLLCILLSLDMNSAFVTVTFAFIILSILYSIPPAYLKAYPLVGTVCASLLYGVLPLMAGFAAFSSLSLLPNSVLLVSFLLAFAAVSIKDFESYMGDKQYEIRTFPVMYGKDVAAQLSGILLLLPFALTALFVYLGAFPTNAYIVALLGFWALLLARSLVHDPSKENGKAVAAQAILLGMLSMLLLALAFAGK